MLQIYNTLTQTKAPFAPLIPKQISLYVCGITVYDFCHIGHARVFVAFDVIVRFLRYTGWTVNYVRNITDIDDKIIKRALENSETVTALTERFIKHMIEDETALNVQRPTHEPRATEHMDQIISMIQQLADQGFAYVADNGDVYFQVDKCKDYGALSHRDLDQLQSGARVDIVEAKRSPLDFVLWKQAKPNEVHWPSPWGEGRPGWHIECSAMSTAVLGNTFDIHGGGADLIFPHHENEKAQSECATGKHFVNNWMHVGFVQINKEKMSKSLNNFFTIREVLKEYDAEVVRYFLISSHYHSPVNYSQEQLQQAKNALERFYTALRDIVIPENVSLAAGKPYQQRFVDAMNDDFNTPVALSVLFDLVHAINTAPEKNDPTIIELAATLKELAAILGILDSSPESFLQGKPADAHAIEQLIAAREQARAAKDWQKADEYRAQLDQLGVVLEDQAGKTVWRKK
jgi:cysteinyl-tRNA synthetase